MLPIEVILAFELITNQNVMKRLCFEFLSRILTGTLQLNLVVKIIPIQIILALELATNQNIMKRLCFEFLSRIFTSTLTLRRRIT